MFKIKQCNVQRFETYPWWSVMASSPDISILTNGGSLPILFAEASLRLAVAIYVFSILSCIYYRSLVVIC